MTIKLKAKPVDDGSIPICELKMNQVGVITSASESSYVGLVVKRNGCDVLFAVEFAEWWACIPREENFRVKVLPNGTQLVVADNE